jgi:hypothetical protein
MFGLGNLLLYVAYIKTDDSTTDWMRTVTAFCAFNFMAGLGSCASFMATLAVNLENFPSERSGLVSGVLGVFCKLDFIFKPKYLSRVLILL